MKLCRTDKATDEQAVETFEDRYKKPVSACMDPHLDIRYSYCSHLPDFELQVIKMLFQSFSSTMVLHLSLLFLGAAYALASPARVPRQETVTVTQTLSVTVPSSTAWDAGAVPFWPIHESCNRTERAQLERGLGETIKLVNHARDHILRWGNSSEAYQKYFGNAPTGEPIGWFEKVVNGDKAGILFRCDNPDGNCDQEGMQRPGEYS